MKPEVTLGPGREKVAADVGPTVARTRNKKNSEGAHRLTKNAPIYRSSRDSKIRDASALGRQDECLHSTGVDSVFHQFGKW